MMLILTKKKFCAIMDAVRVHFEEFGGLLRDKEVIVHGIHNLFRPRALHGNADSGDHIVLSDLP